MFLTLLALGCSEPEAHREVSHWPRPGVEAIVEVSARVNAEGEAMAWSAAAWSEERPSVPVSGGCVEVGGRADVAGLAAIDVSAPVSTRLNPTAGRGMEASGPLTVRDARWAVGDVHLLSDDAVSLHLEGVLRFGDAVEFTAVVVGAGGEVYARVAPQPDTTVELDVVGRGGRVVRCSATEDGLLMLPAGLAEAAESGVVLRGVHDALVVVPNAALLRVRAVVERSLSLTDPVASDRSTPVPRGSAPPWSPRRVLRDRLSLG